MYYFLADFKRWAIPPRVKVGPELEYKKPDVKMESTSTFQQVKSFYFFFFFQILKII